MKVEWVESFCFWTLPTWSWENETEAHEPHIVAPGQARCECCECHGSHPKAVEAEPASAKPETEYGTEDLEHLWIYWILLDSIYTFCVQEAWKKHWEHGSELRQTPSAPPNLPGEVSQGGALQQLIVSALKKDWSSYSGRSCGHSRWERTGFS